MEWETPIGGEDNIERRATTTKQPNNSWKSFPEDDARTIDFFLKRKYLLNLFLLAVSGISRWTISQTNNYVFSRTVRGWKLFRRINDSVITLRPLCGNFLCVFVYLTQDIRMLLWGRFQHRDRVLATATCHCPRAFQMLMFQPAVTCDHFHTIRTLYSLSGIRGCLDMTFLFDLLQPKHLETETKMQV